MWDRMATGPELCLRDVGRNRQSPQTSEIISEVLLMWCSPMHALECKGWKTPPKKIFLHLFKVMSIKDQNHPQLAAARVTPVILGQNTSEARERGVQAKPPFSSTAPRNQTPCTVTHVSPSFSLAARSALLPQPACACARLSTGNGSDDASRRSRLMVWSQGVGGKKKKKGLPIAYDFWFAKQ